MVVRLADPGKVRHGPASRATEPGKWQMSQTNLAQKLRVLTFSGKRTIFSY